MIVVAHSNPPELADEWYDTIAYGQQYMVGNMDVVDQSSQATVFDYLTMTVWQQIPESFYTIIRCAVVMILGCIYLLLNPARLSLVAILFLPLALVDGATTPSQLYGALLGGLMVICARKQGFVVLTAAVILSFALSLSYASWWIWFGFLLFAANGSIGRRFLIVVPVLLVGLCGPAGRLLLVGTEHWFDIWILLSENSLLPMLLGLYEPSFYQHRVTAALLVLVMFLLILSRGTLSSASRRMIFYAAIVILATNAGAAVLALAAVFAAGEIGESFDVFPNQDRQPLIGLSLFSFSILTGTLVGLYIASPVYSYMSELMTARRTLVNLEGERQSVLDERPLFVPISHSGAARLLGVNPGYDRRMFYRLNSSTSRIDDFKKYDLINKFQPEAETNLRKDFSAVILPEFHPLAGLLREKYHWFDLLKIDLPARPLSRPRQVSAVFLLLPPEAKSQLGG